MNGDGTNGNGTNENAPMANDPIVDRTSGEGVAEQYIRTELKRARDGLLRTQIISALVVLGLGGYTIWATSRFRAALQPTEAATIAKGLVSDRLETGAVQFADYVKKEVPNYIRKAPDYAIERLPEFREGLEGRVNREIETYAKSSSEQLGQQVDTFLENNKESVGTLLKDGQNPETTAKMNAELKALFVRYLDEPMPNGGESMKAKLDQALEVLNKVDARMTRLATAKDLTPAETNAKRAIAVLLKQIHEKRMDEGHEDAIAPKVIEGVRTNVQAAVESGGATLR